MLLLCLCLLLSALAVPAFADEVPIASSEASEEPTESSEAPEESEDENGVVDSGTCGENLTWTLDKNGVLTISGTGEMGETSYENSPWEKELVKIIVIESGVTSISEYAFKDCTNLLKISISDTVQSMGYGTFYGCTNLESVKLPSELKTISGCMLLGCKKVTEIQIPETVTLIEEAAFSSTGLKYVVIPEGVTEIGDSAFHLCFSLRNVVFPSTVHTIGKHAFAWTGLQNIQLPDNLVNIEEYAFEGCDEVTSITIPKSVERIGKNAFATGTYNGAGMGILSEVHFLGDAPDMEENIFAHQSMKSYYPNNKTWTNENMLNYGGTITWVAYEPNSDSTEVPEPTEKPSEDLSYMLKIEGEGEIQITEGLKAAGIGSIEQVKERLLACVLQNEGYTAEKTDLMEILLRVSADNGYTWRNVSAENFPESGEVRVTLPYPQGAPKDTPKENYKVYHMFTENINGHKAGEIEECPVEKIDEGLLVTLHGLSPVIIAWTPVNETVKPTSEPTAAPSTEPTSAPSATPNATPTDAPSAAPTEKPAVNAPQTGDNGVSMLWFAVLLVSGSAAAALFLRKRVGKR